jgi:GTP cyclohydrolase I
VSRLDLDTERIEEEPYVLRMPAVADVDDREDVEGFDVVGRAGVTEVRRPRLHLHRMQEGEVDLDRAAGAVAELLNALGVDPSADGLEDTPDRVAKALAEMLTPEPFDVTTFANDEGYDELVVARAIPFASLCEHHLLPFSGLAYVGYLPDERLVGLSKLARVVDHFSRRLQVQERLTAQVANYLQCTLQPKGVGVVLEAEHLCMSLRGVRADGARTVTSALKGLVRDDPRTRAEFLSLAGTRE